MAKTIYTCTGVYVCVLHVCVTMCGIYICVITSAWININITYMKTVSIGAVEEEERLTVDQQINKFTKIF